MTALARSNNNSKLQIHPLIREESYIRTITASVELESKITGREYQGAWHQDEMIDGKQPVVK
jgi:hypothetical protein